jgi:hypothetical protein
MKRVLLLAGAVAVALTISGCKGGGGRSAGQTVGGSTKSGDPPKTTAAMFGGDVQPIFTKKCAHPSCHGVAESAGLRLSKGMAYKDIVNVPAIEDSSMMIIKPGEPDSSYLVLKIEGKAPVGARMPLTGGYLSSSEIQTIVSWVKAGAKDN